MRTILSRRALFTISTSGMLLAGCIAGSGVSGRVDRSDEATNTNAIGVSNVHLMPVKRFSSDSLKNQSAPFGAHLTYYGGPVISNVKVFTIFWGTGVNYTTQLDAFYAGVTNSAYFDWLSEYDTPSQKIGRGTFAGSYSYTTGAKGTVDDSQIQSALSNLISSGKVPAPDANTLYAIHFAPGITITQGGSASCQYFCAYHGTIQSGSSYIYYSVIPDQGGACAGGCGSDPSQLNNTESVASHEMIEAVTDAAVGAATGTASPLAWYDTTNGEIGDICNGQQGSVLGGDGKTYVVQQEFSNKANNCIVTGSGSTSSSSSSSSTSASSSSSSSSGSSSSSASSTSSSSSSSSTSSSSGGGACAHGICTQGTHLKSGCDSCATAICSQDPYCCTTAWDNVCVGEVGSICGESCSGGSSSSSSSSSSTTTSSSGGGTTCGHAICATGTKLKTSCDPCVLDICSQDPYCCTNKWDSICVSEVGSICGEGC
jgi:hypothetical protein